jgi:NTP pyrophosphatase (non-canonical NTP hydrolase)
MPVPANLTLDQFAFLASRTESKTVDANILNASPLSSLRQSIRDCSKQADELKRAIFYSPSGVEQAPASYPRGLHALLGIVSELDELQEAQFIGDTTNIAEEIGDLLWYLALAANAAGLSLSACGRATIEKLNVRYPEAFTSTSALNRDLDAEMAALLSALAEVPQ